MADATPDNNTLCGFLVPWAFSPTLAADHVRGTDFDEADRRPQGVTPPAGSKLALEPSGDAESGAENDYYIVTPSPGVAGPDSLGVAFASSSGGTFHGANKPTVVVGWEEQTVATSALGWDQLTLADQTIVAVSWGHGSSTFTYYAHIRSKDDGTWTQATITTDADGSESRTGVCLVEAPDGTLLAYYVLRRDGRAFLGCSRSTNNGAAWTVQSRDVCGNLVSDVAATVKINRIRAASNQSSQILILVEWDDGGGGSSQHTAQYVSVDGGVSAVYVADNDGDALGDLISTGGYFVVATQDEGTDAVYIWRGGDAKTSIWESTATQLTDARAADEMHGMALLSSPDGVLYLYTVGNSRTASATDIYGHRSIDYGATWQTGTLVPIPVYDGGVVGLTNFDVSYSRGYAVMVGCETNTTTPPSLPTFTPGDVHELYLGGHSSFTLSQDAWGWSTYNSVVAPAPRSSVGATWAPMESLAQGWAANSDTGTPARVPSSAGMTITCGSGVVAGNPRTSTMTNAGGKGVAMCVVKVTSGTFTFKVSVGKTGGSTDGCDVEVSVTSTQISFVEQGASHVYVNHNQTGYIAIYVVVDAGAAKGRYWYGAASTLQPRTMITGSVTTTGNSDEFVVNPRVEASSVVALKFLAAVEWDSANTMGPTWVSGGFTTADLDCVPLGPTIPTYIDDGISLVSREGYAYGSSAEWIVPIRGQRPKENTLPTHRPSPRQGWRSSGTSTQTLKYTLDVDNGAAMRIGSPVFGVYLDGLYGVGSVTIKDNGSTVGSATLKHDVQMTRVGYALHPTESGPRSEGVYVEQDELKGGMVDLGSSKVRKIIGNTAGTLQSGGTVDTKRAVVFVEGIDGTESSSGAYDIYPPRALIYVYERATWTRLDIVIDTSEPVGPEGYREIGLVAAGPVYCVGMLNSRQTSLAFEDGATMVTLDDGTRRSIERHPTRRRAEVSWTYSPVDVRQIREAATTPPDYVLAKTGGAVPAAMRYDAPLLVSAIYAGINGKSTPVVWLPYVPVSTGTAVHLGARALEALYGRIVGPIRRERASFGLPMQSEGFTLSTVTIEEEL